MSYHRCFWQTQRTRITYTDVSRGGNIMDMKPEPMSILNFALLSLTCMVTHAKFTREPALYEGCGFFGHGLQQVTCKVS